MRIHLRQNSNGHLYITLPKFICEHLDYQKGMMLYGMKEDEELILTKENNEDWDDLVISSKLVQRGNSKSLSFPIPPKMSLLLKYYKDQELELAFESDRIFLSKNEE